MEQSILKSTKEVLHIAVDDPSFDLSIITQINSAFSTLNDLGVGPDDGFVIDGDAEDWEDFLISEADEAKAKVQRAQIKTFILLTVRLAFDPPQVAFLLQSAERQLTEITWRISTRREQADYRDPVEELVTEIDGGDAG